MAQKLAKNIPVLIAVRDIPSDDKNPFSTEQTVRMLETVYAENDAEVIVVPDIESINYGRGVGYEINEFVPPKDVGFISATAIRQQIREEKSDWKNAVDKKIHTAVKKYLCQ